ncbi:hypothetical protein AgCh_032498 [Apium graveolens]
MTLLAPVIFDIIYYILQITIPLLHRHYDLPDGFTFEINDVSPPIQDDVLLFDYNVEEIVNGFLAAALSQTLVTGESYYSSGSSNTDHGYERSNIENVKVFSPSTPLTIVVNFKTYNRKKGILHRALTGGLIIEFEILELILAKISSLRLDLEVVDEL